MQTKNSPTQERRVPPLLVDGHIPSLGHVLLTEIDPVAAATLKGRLADSGYTVTYMRSGVEARWSLFSARYDALIVSLGSHKNGSLDLARDVAKHRRLPPVIALATEDLTGVQEAKELGATCITESDSRTREVTDALHRLLS